MVQVAIGGGSQLQCSKADVIKCLVVDTESLIRVLHKLMNRKGSIVGLDNSVRNLRAGHHGVGIHDPVGEFFSYLGDQKCAHARASAAAKRVSELETLKTIATFSLLSHDVKHAVHQLCTFCVVTLGPVVPSTALTKDKVVWPAERWSNKVFQVILFNSIFSPSFSCMSKVNQHQVLNMPFGHHLHKL